MGTVFEVGYMLALDRPVFGWSNSAAYFTARTRAFLHREDGTDGEGLSVEEFPGMRDNLMIDGAIAASGGVFVAREAARWQDLAAFEDCVAQAAAALGR